MKYSAGLLLAALAASPAAASPVGTWRVPDGQYLAIVKPCGKNICATINGAPVLNSMRHTGANVWVGTISDVRSNSLYDGTVTQVNENSLDVRGCLRGSTTCGDQTWTRVKGGRR